MAVVADPHIRTILRDDSLTRGLEDTEARMLVEWVVEWAELFTDAAKNDDDAMQLVARLRRRGKAIGRFVQLWTDPRTRASAVQLAAVERFAWPMPSPLIDSAELMHQILLWENEHPSN